MTLDKARELFKVQAGFGGFYNRNSAKLMLAEVSREHGQAAPWTSSSGSYRSTSCSASSPAAGSRAGWSSKLRHRDAPIAVPRDAKKTSQRRSKRT